MDTIRTTITLPIELHEKLRLMSITQKKPLGELIAEKLSSSKISETSSAENKMRKFRKLRNQIRKASSQFDAVLAVREERNRDNG